MQREEMVNYAVELGSTITELRNHLLDPKTGIVPTLQRQVTMLHSQLEVSQKINQALMKQLGIVERITTENAQYARRETLELHGIPESFGEGETLECNVIKLVNDLISPEKNADATPGAIPGAGDANYAEAVSKTKKLDKRNFHTIHRLYKKNRVILKFTNRRDAQMVIAKKAELKKQEVKNKHHLKNPVFLNESMCAPIKRLFYQCKKLKEANKLAYYSFFNGTLKVKITEEGPKRSIAHINDLSRATNLTTEEILAIVGGGERQD